jgi:hypothetical protein
VLWRLVAGVNAVIVAALTTALRVAPADHGGCSHLRVGRPSRRVLAAGPEERDCGCRE